VIGSAKKRGSLLAEDFAISAMSSISGSSETNLPMQPLNRPRFFNVTKHPQGAFNSGSSDSGFGAGFRSTTASTVSRATFKSVCFC
jgi:hypothetical protein